MRLYSSRTTANMVQRRQYGHALTLHERWWHHTHTNTTEHSAWPYVNALDVLLNDDREEEINCTREMCFEAGIGVG